MGSIEYYLAVLYCLSMVLFVIWQVSCDQGRNKRYENLRLNHAFYCQKCGEVYLGLGAVKEKACPKCSNINQSLSF